MSDAFTSRSSSHRYPCNPTHSSCLHSSPGVATSDVFGNYNMVRNRRWLIATTLTRQSCSWWYRAPSCAGCTPRQESAIMRGCDALAVVGVSWHIDDERRVHRLMEATA